MAIRRQLVLEKENAEKDVEIASLKLEVASLNRQIATWRVYQDDLVDAINELTKRKDQAG